MTIPWSQNDALFFRECGVGHFWERYVALFLKQQGLRVDVGEQSFRDSISQADRYSAIIDILCDDVPLEVKSRGLVYHVPADLPYPDLFVDTVNGWKQKPVPPAHIVCVSQHTGSMIYLDVEKTFDAWTQRKAFDRTRRIEDLFFYARKELWRPIESLVSQLKLLRPCVAPVLGGPTLPHPSQAVQ